MTLAGAGTALASGADPSTAVGVGLASAGYSGSMEVERAHRAEQRATGFWARMKIRIIG
jgi:hypothetical protein